MEAIISEFNNMNMSNTRSDIDNLSNLMQQVEIKKYINNGNNEVKEFLKGKQLTKKLKKKMTTFEINRWQKETKKRYNSYRNFEDDDHRQEYQEIIKLIKLVNKKFECEINKRNIKEVIAIVKYSDNKLKKILIEMNCIEKI